MAVSRRGAGEDTSSDNRGHGILYHMTRFIPPHIDPRKLARSIGCHGRRESTTPLIWSAKNLLIFTRPSNISPKSKKDQIWEIFPGQPFRFIDLYGEKLPELSEEEMKIFNVWMEHWLDQRLVEFHISRHFQAKAELWR